MGTVTEEASAARPDWRAIAAGLAEKWRLRELLVSPVPLFVVASAAFARSISRWLKARSRIT